MPDARATPGPLALADALAFLLAHHRHHDAQVARTLAVVAPGHAAGQ